MTHPVQATTLRIDKALYQRAKAAAAAQGVTLTRFIEQSLQDKLAQKPAPRREIKLPTFNSGHGFNYSPEELKQMAIDTDYGLELIDPKYKDGQ